MIAPVLLAAALSLNGSWEFRFDEGKTHRDASPAFAATDTMVVPGCYDMMPKWLCKRGTGLYRRRFVLSEAVADARLVVDGMGLTGRFAIDGRELGVYPYPYARLEIPTGALSVGEHEVFVALDNRFDWSYLKLARPYYDFYCFGGFYHGVSLETDLRKLRVRTRDHEKGTVEIEAVGFPRAAFTATAAFDGTNRVALSFVDGRATVRVPGARLWSPDAPNLHTVALDGVTARFGIRTVEAKNRRIYLNGKPIYLKGANRHESHPTFGAATPETLMLLDIQNLKTIGGNFFRGCHYQQSQRFLDLCDEMGVMVWEESLGWGNGSHHRIAQGELTNETFRAQQVWETREMVRASFNHPSVIIFAFMNEFASQKKEGKTLADELIAAIRAEDSGRLVTFACSHSMTDICNANTDIIAYNTYPGWFDNDGVGDEANFRRLVKEDMDKIVGRFRKIYPDKPIMVSEMGVCAVYGFHDPAGAQWTEEFQAGQFATIIDAVFGNPELCGLAIWHFADARSYHRSGAAIRGKPFAENLAGIYDDFRRAKLAVQVVKERYVAK